MVVYFSAGQARTSLGASVRSRASSTKAQDLYLKGRYFWARRTPDDLNKAIDYFTQAIVQDPGYAQAYVGLADLLQPLARIWREAYPRALVAAQRAVRIDDSSAEAHVSLAFAEYWWSWKAISAEHEFKRALKLNPELVRAHY